MIYKLNENLGETKHVEIWVLLFFSFYIIFSATCRAIRGIHAMDFTQILLGEDHVNAEAGGISSRTDPT